MANYIFRRYLSEKEKVLQLANSMLEAHIGDAEGKADTAQLLDEKKSELARLSRKLDSYIEMRSDGEISKEVFRIKTDEIEPAITQLQNEIADLERQAQTPLEIVDYEEKLAVLSYALEQYTNADENDVPESVIEAFVVKIVASKNGFDWYLRFDGNPNDPLHCTIQGKHKSNAQVSVSGTSSPAMHDSATGCHQGRCEVSTRFGKRKSHNKRTPGFHNRESVSIQAECFCN